MALHESEDDQGKKYTPHLASLLLSYVEYQFLQSSRSAYITTYFMSLTLPPRLRSACIMSY